MTLVATATGDALDPTTGVVRHYVAGQPIPSFPAWAMVNRSGPHAGLQPTSPTDADDVAATNLALVGESCVIFEHDVPTSIAEMPLWNVPPTDYEQVQP